MLNLERYGTNSVHGVSLQFDSIQTFAYFMIRQKFARQNEVNLTSVNTEAQLGLMEEIIKRVYSLASLLWSQKLQRQRPRTIRNLKNPKQSTRLRSGTKFVTEIIFRNFVRNVIRGSRQRANGVTLARRRNIQMKNR